MLSTAESIKKKMAEVLASGIKQTDIAAHCGVSKQAVQSWKNTGRIDKRHLAGLAEVTKRPLGWWLEISDEAAEQSPEWEEIRFLRVGESSAPYGSDRVVWPFKKVDMREYALLNEHQRSLVEAYIRGLIDEATRNKRDGASHAA